MRHIQALLPERVGDTDVGDLRCEGVWVLIPDDAPDDGPCEGVLDNRPITVPGTLHQMVKIAPNALGDDFKPVIVALL
jgi:hypothetical protein